MHTICMHKLSRKDKDDASQNSKSTYAFAAKTAKASPPSSPTPRRRTIDSLDSVRRHLASVGHVLLSHKRPRRHLEREQRHVTHCKHARHAGLQVAVDLLTAQQWGSCQGACITAVANPAPGTSYRSIRQTFARCIERPWHTQKGRSTSGRAGRQNAAVPNRVKSRTVLTDAGVRANEVWVECLAGSTCSSTQRSGPMRCAWRSKKERTNAPCQPAIIDVFLCCRLL